MPETREEYNARMKAYMKKRYQRRRVAAIEQLGSCCRTCGSLEDLNFDHVDAKEKSFPIGARIAGMSEAKLQAELKKCQLLCGSCHKQKTLEAGEYQKTGEQNPRARLTEAQVLEIRRRYRPRSKVSGASALAREFGVSRHTVSLAVRRVTWKHV